MAWVMLRNPILNPIYFFGFLGYAEPNDILKDCLKDKIKIKFMAFNAINDKDSKWTKIRGKW